MARTMSTTKADEMREIECFAMERWSEDRQTLRDLAFDTEDVADEALRRCEWWVALSAAVEATEYYLVDVG